MLRAARKARRMSQLELSMRVGVSQRHMSFVESGRPNPNRALPPAWAEELQPPPPVRNPPMVTRGAFPYATALLGARGHRTGRIYFSDIVDKKPRVQWKDLGKRTPGVDYTIPGVNKYFTKDYLPTIQPAKSLPLMDLWKRTSIEDGTPDEGKLSKVSRAVVAMSGELRDPRLVRTVIKDPSITAVMNPNIGGWLGNMEAVGASVQARARLLELGLIGYRVGQTAGTELIVPWLDGEAPSTVAPNKAFLRFTAPLPYQRLETGYTAGLWVFALYLAPIVGTALLLMWLLGGALPPAYRLRA